MEAWRAEDVSSWVEDHTEPRGKRVKVWVKDLYHQFWLRKEPRRPSEPALEALMLRLAREVKIDAPESLPCTWKTQDGNIKRGIVVRFFLRNEEQLSIGSDELKATDPSYDPTKHDEHTLARVRASLKGESGPAMLRAFAHILTFDAWIGNADRHQENWGVIRGRMGAPRLAPLFDPAACLGVELDDNHALLRGEGNLSTYLARCPSGFGRGGRSGRFRGILQDAVLAELADWPEWRENRDSWLASFAAAMDTLGTEVDNVPDEWLSSPRREFVKRVLRERLSWLVLRGL